MHRSEYVHRQEIRSIHVKMVRLSLRGGINSGLVYLLGPLGFFMFSKFLACMLPLKVNKATVLLKIIRPSQFHPFCPFLSVLMFPPGSTFDHLLFFSLLD